MSGDAGSDPMASGDPSMGAAPTDGAVPMDGSTPPETGGGGGGAPTDADGDGTPDDVSGGGGGMDNRFNISGGGGGGGGGFGSDDSSGDASGMDDGSGDGDATEEPPPSDPVGDAVMKLSELASEPPTTKNDTLALIKATKGLIQHNFTSKTEVGELIDKLSEEETPALKELAERLRVITAITKLNDPKPSTQGNNNQMKPPVTPSNKTDKATPSTAQDDSGLTAVQESMLKELISETVTKVIAENSSYTAMRKLAIQAQETSLDFEKNIVTLLGILDPDLMQGEARQVYHKAVEGMKEKMVNAVLTAAQILARLPKKDDGKTN